MTTSRRRRVLTGLTVLDVTACGWVWAVLGWWQPAAVEAVALALAWTVFGRNRDEDELHEVRELRRDLGAYSRACTQCRKGLWAAAGPAPAEPRMRKAHHD